MQSFGDIIEAFGIGDLATILGVPDSHIRTMKSRDSIPVEFWQTIIANAPDALRDDLTFDRLLALRAAKKRVAS